MLELLGTIIGIGLAYVASKWSYGRTLLELGQQGIELAKATGLDDKIPDKVREVAEQAVIAANQREIEQLVAKLTKLHDDGKAEAQRALERGRELGAGMDVTVIEPDGTEPTSKPFGKE